MRAITACLLTLAAAPAAATLVASAAPGDMNIERRAAVRDAPDELPGSLVVTSPAFREGGMIPDTYSRDGRNLSPPLAWTTGPRGTACYAVEVLDPDAPNGTWVHWIAWNIPVTRLEENASSHMPSGSVQGVNSYGKNEYDGPQPAGGTHRYYFEVYALRTPLDLKSDADRTDFDAAIRGRVLAVGRLTGSYAVKR